MTPAEILDGAADAIERHGFVQGDLGDPAYGFCAIGAMSFAVSGNAHGVMAGSDRANFAEARRALGRRVSTRGDVLGFGIVDWNNAPGRTREEVVTAMRETAAGLRGRTP